MAKFILIEREKFDENHTYQEDYDTLEEAQERMKELYHEVAIEGNPDAIEVGKLYERSAYVRINDGNVIGWDIEEV